MKQNKVPFSKPNNPISPNADDLNQNSECTALESEQDAAQNDFNLLPRREQLQVSSAPQAAFSNTQNSCFIFWDLENVPVPSAMNGSLVVDNIRRAIQHFGPIKQFKAYTEIKDAGSKQLRSELQSSGVTLIDCQHNGRKDAIDHMIIVDMMLAAADHPTPLTIVLISGDKDFVYALSSLRNRLYNVVLIVPNDGANAILRTQANIVLEWRYDVLGQNAIANMQSNAFSSRKNVSSVGNSPSPSRKGTNTNPSPHQSTNSSPTKQGQGSILKGLNLTTSTSNMDLESRPSTGGLKKSYTTDQLSQLSKQKAQQTFRNSPSTSLTVNTEATGSLKDATADERYFALSPMAPGFFELLFEILERHRLEGDLNPSKKKIGDELLHRNPLICSRVGLNSIFDYIDLAARQGIVKVGKDANKSNEEWVSLCNNFINTF